MISSLPPNNVPEILGVLLLFFQRCGPDTIFLYRICRFKRLSLRHQDKDISTQKKPFSFVQCFGKAVCRNYPWALHLSGPYYTIRTYQGTNQNSSFRCGPIYYLMNLSNLKLVITQVTFSIKNNFSNWEWKRIFCAEFVPCTHRIQ